MTPKLEQLLEQVNQTYPGTVMVRTGDAHSGLLRMDRVQQSFLADRLLIELPDTTESDFVIGNELLQLLLSLNGIVPQIFFGLTFEDDGLDQQLVTIASRLHHLVMHGITYRELAKQGFLTAQTVEAFKKGIEDELSPEDDVIDGQHLFRLLSLTDAQVFLMVAENAGQKAGAQESAKRYQQLYPKANAAAKSLADLIMSSDLKDSRVIRKTIVQVFSGLDDLLQQVDLPTVNAKQYVTLTPVLSERQLNGPVKNTFEIFHSEMTDFASKEKAYVGLGKNDQQNAFVIAPPKNPADRPKFFTELYALSVKALLEKLALPYILRR
ncbi:nitrate ABC transporter ATPase [Fructobacillus sp. M1-13]|uniref:Nitrate ABC transporter ATPase n=1 Tax=Fructobacillus papyriferae TaxID=2713171 RepID=A0ABS5QQZ3_9LACO|nr:nitrate ABC transporter ATPase [Fructobacillus papyriferae]MBS9335237.1 nitrate ABC transporter ATPase [Fructobacillus papyriferae]MCD2159094.1 nitrate ABC transporter ATPase [Fructobacillus papyriferae]